MRYFAAAAHDTSRLVFSNLGRWRSIANVVLCGLQYNEKGPYFLKNDERTR
jgi:hypothetical protein